MKVLLCRTSSREPPHTIVPGDKPAQIGRDPTADIPILERQISHRHCELKKVGDKLLVRDLGSKNGTFVNYIRVNERLLAPADSLVIGRLEFTVQFKAEAAAEDAQSVAGEPIQGDTAALQLPALTDDDVTDLLRQIDTEVADMGDTVVLPDEVVVMGATRHKRRRTVAHNLPHVVIPPPMAQRRPPGDRSLARGRREKPPWLRSAQSPRRRL